MPYDEHRDPGQHTETLPRREEGGGSGHAAREERPAPPPQRRRRPWLLPLLAVALIAATIGIWWYWHATRYLESTDDAYTDGNVVTVAPQVSGQVVELAVNDNQRVQQGQVLVRIDPRPFVDARDQARGALDMAEGQLAATRYAVEVARKNFPARLDSARAQRDAAAAVLFRAQTDLKRQLGLPKAATTQQAVDEAIAAERQATAQLAEAEAAVREAEPVQANISQVEAQAKQLQGNVEQARAQLAQAELNLDWSVVKAPQDGWVTKRNVDPGNYATAGAAILSLVTSQVWITANFKETQLDRMRAGQPVRITVDAYPGLDLHGHVDSVQLGSGSKFTAFPPENATGNFVKIVQRVPVKIAIDSGMDPKLPLPMGISVEPTVNVKERG